MPPTTGMAAWARMLMAATPPVVALMVRTVWLISPAFWLIWLTVLSMLLAVSRTCWAWPDRGWAAARISSAMRPVSFSFWVSSRRDTLDPGPTSVMITLTLSSIWVAASTTRDSSMTANRAKAMTRARLNPTMPFSLRLWVIGLTHTP